MASLWTKVCFGNWLSTCRTQLGVSRFPGLGAYFTTARSIEERLGYPPKPKRPLTPYFRYMTEMRPVVLQEHPGSSLTDIVKIIAKKWEKLDEAAKVKLQEAYRKDQAIYVEQRAKYDSKITSDQRRQMQEMRQQLAEAKEKRALRKRIKELGRPKKPASAFLKFIVRERETSVNNENYKEWHSKVCEKWARLSNDEKEKLKAECRKEMEIYKQNISKWEEKMVRMGNIDVVRQEAMIEPSTVQKKPREVNTNKVH